MKASEIVEKTGHDAKGTGGFDYQFLYFVNKLLCMSQKGDVVSYEKYDDVSLQNGETLIYYQLKHTIAGTKEKPVNLALRDPDLWKTIYVWIDIANKQNNPKEFLETNKFVLVTNKKSTDNSFWLKMQQLKKGKISYTEVKDFCQKTYEACKNPEVKDGQAKKENLTKKYIKTLKDFEFAEELLCSMNIEFETDLKASIFDSLRLNKHIPDKNIEDAYYELLGAIKDNYVSHKLDTYTREDFDKSFGRIINKYRDRKFEFKTINNIELPANLEKQTFIRQLIDVQDLREDELDLIVDYTREKLNYINNINDLLKSDDVSYAEVELARDDAHRIWFQKFRYYFRHVNVNDEEKIIEKASELLNDIRNQKLDFVEVILPVSISNGCYYYMSDKDDDHEPRIGWRPGWENKYK